MTHLVPISSSRYDLCADAHDYLVWEGQPQRSILICTHPRSGSTMLAEALYFTGGLGCPLEFIHAGSRPGFEKRWGVIGMRHVTREAWRRRTDPGGTFAAKIFWRDVAEMAAELAPGTFPDLLAVPADEVLPETYCALDELLRELFPEPVHLHLDRRDRLRQAVSGLTAAQTGAWRSIPGIERDTSEQIVVYDFHRISAMMEMSIFCHAHWQAFFCANGIRPHAVTYEMLVADYTGTIKPLLQALGHSGEVPLARMERQSTVRNEALMLRFLRDQSALMRTNTQ